MHDVRARGKLGRVARARSVEVGVQHGHRPDARERRCGERGLDLIRLRSGSPSGATRSSAWKTVTASPANVSASSSSSIRRGVWPPLSASENAPLRDRRCGGFGDQLGGAGGGQIRVVADLDREPRTAAQLGFSSWPPNCFRIAESTLFPKSSRSREAKSASRAPRSGPAPAPPPRSRRSMSSSPRRSPRRARRSRPGRATPAARLR